VQAEHSGNLAIRHFRIGFDELHNHRMRPRSGRTGYDLCLDHIRRLAKQCPVLLVHLPYPYQSGGQSENQELANDEFLFAMLLFPSRLQKRMRRTTGS
jgi:hypothetical protein